MFLKKEDTHTHSFLLQRVFPFSIARRIPGFDFGGEQGAHEGIRGPDNQTKRVKSLSQTGTDILLPPTHSPVLQRC